MITRHLAILAAVAAVTGAFGGSAPAGATPGDTTWVRTFDNDFYNWATPHEASFTLPGAGVNWQKILLFYRISCPSAPADCDPWDRIGYVQVLHDTGAQDSTGAPLLEPYEIARIITPYDITGGLRPGSCTWVLDVSDYKTLLRGDVMLRSYIESWIGGIRGWIVTVDLAFIEGDPPLEPYKVVNLWNRYYTVYGDPARPVEGVLTPLSIPIDEVAVAAKVRVITTGHGQGNTQNCAEFCSKEHAVFVNGDEFSHLLWRSNCGMNPCSPQGGTWPASRAGWCPGDAVAPWDVVVTASVTPGGMATLDYDVTPYENFCRPTNPSCVDGVTCGDCDYNDTGHTEPHYSIQSQLILYAPAGSAGVPAGDPGSAMPGAHGVHGVELLGNAPNPFGPATAIRYTLTEPRTVTLVITNAGGRLVRRIAQPRETAGSFETVWDGRDDAGLEAPPGVYYVDVEGASGPAARTMIRLR